MKRNLDLMFPWLNEIVCSVVVVVSPAIPAEILFKERTISAPPGLVNLHLTRTRIWYENKSML